MEAIQQSSMYLPYPPIIFYLPKGRKLNKYEKGEYALYRKIEPSLGKVEQNIFLVEEEREQIIRVLNGMLKILEAADRKDHAHHYSGSLNVVFERINRINGYIGSYNRDLCRSNGHLCRSSPKLKAEFGYPASLPIIEDEEERESFNETTRDADLRHYTHNEELYWRG